MVWGWRTATNHYIHERAQPPELPDDTSSIIRKRHDGHLRSHTDPDRSVVVGGR
jgi:hypothetical protein